VIDNAGDYSPKSCGLCGSQALEVILDKATPLSMLSDNKTIPISLRKIECINCGLVRDGHEANAEKLNRYYRFDYTLNVNFDEYHFLTLEGAVPRSKLFFDWIWRHLGVREPEQIRKVLEVGCGAGHLLARVRSAMPEAYFFGTELSQAARKMAIDKGFHVILGGIEQVDESGFDLIYTVGVLEHVPHPGDFLSTLRKRLAPGGTLVLVQPSQDVISSDIYFSDHLHHFGTDHLSMYAQRIGFTEVVKEVGYTLMPNFSLHLWERSEPSSDHIRWGNTQCRESIAFHEGMFEQVNRLVDEIQSNPARKLAVFGLNERYALLHAYSRLGDIEIVCGLSDVEPNVQVDFPVVKPGRVKEFPVTDVLMCVNQIHKQYVSERLAPLGVTVHAL